MEKCGVCKNLEVTSLWGFGWDIRLPDLVQSAAQGCVACDMLHRAIVAQVNSLDGLDTVSIHSHRRGRPLQVHLWTKDRSVVQLELYTLIGIFSNSVPESPKLASILTVP